MMLVATGTGGVYPPSLVVSSQETVAAKAAVGGSNSNSVGLSSLEER